MNTQSAEPIDGVSKRGTINPGIEPEAKHTLENKSPLALQISSTARQSGYGSGMHRVASLTAEERHAVVCGKRVFYRAERVSGKGPNGTFWRVAKVSGREICPRVPTSDEVASLRANTGLA